MKPRRWPFLVRDSRGRTHYGSVVWASAAPARTRPPEPPDEFRIVVLDRPAAVPAAPERTAVCTPSVPAIHAVEKPGRVVLPDDIGELTLPHQRMAEYAAGRIVMAAPCVVGPEDVFPPHSDRPRLDRLALAILEAASAEELAACVALIRHVLALPPAADVLDELEARLKPEDASAKPPARAPGIVRLRRALDALRSGDAPAVSLDVLGEDLRFLRMFSDDRNSPWPDDALERLLGEVRSEPARRRRPKKAVTAQNVVPFHRPEDA